MDPSLQVLGYYIGGPFKNSRKYGSKRRVIEFVDHGYCGVIDDVLD